jgi:hypothetical protein
MKAVMVSLVSIVVGAAICAAIGLLGECPALGPDWSPIVRGDGARPAEIAWRNIEPWIPIRVNGLAYARLVGWRIYGWTPVAWFGSLVAVWALIRGLARRENRAAESRIPSPAMAYLSKRLACLAAVAACVAPFVPAPLPLWFGFVPWALGAWGVYGFVSNLPERI